MVSNITPLKIISLETRCKRRQAPHFRKANGYFEELKAMNPNNEVKAVYNSAINGMKYSISSKCTKYETLKKIEVWSDSGKKLKKELSDEIVLLKKICSDFELYTRAQSQPFGEQSISSEYDEFPSLFYEESSPNEPNIVELKNDINREITVLENEITVLKSNVNFYSISKKLIEIFPFISNIASETVSILGKYDELNRLYRSRREIIGESDYTDEIEKRIIEKQNKTLNVDVKIWKPKEITKKSLIDRIRLLEKFDHLIPVIEDSEFEKINSIDSGIIELCNELDLIVTSKGNYYLIPKYNKNIIGLGASKIVYKGIDLSKNKPIAVSYVHSRPSKAFKEEKTYLHLRENSENETVKIRDCLVNEKDRVCIFISDLCENGSLSKDLKSTDSKIKKSKAKFCEDLINVIYSAFQKGVIFRDLKSPNIVIDDKLKPRICDLDLTGSTPLTSAPEFLKFNVTNEKTAVWSLGIILYEVYFGNFLKDVYAAAGQKPEFSEHNIILYVANLTDEMIEGLFEKKREELPEQDQRLLGIIQAMLKVNLDNRLTLSGVKKAWKC